MHLHRPTNPTRLTPAFLLAYVHTNMHVRTNANGGRHATGAGKAGATPAVESLAVQIARRNFEHARTADERARAARRLSEAQAAAKAGQK